MMKLYCEVALFDGITCKAAFTNSLQTPELVSSGLSDLLCSDFSNVPLPVLTEHIFDRITLKIQDGKQMARILKEEILL